ncbi:MAG TPA: cyclopropane-fatty-acyl-phospholipid synthase family protein [Solirubrobacteraceae bacterium]|nr:cyclopropane-fatty-acyl-phospholipid synthase family protein [Solirubrobacteraceae bacterium]
MTGDLSRALAGALFDRIREGTLVVHEDGARRTWGQGPPTAHVSVHSPLAWRRLLRTSLGMADAYADGLWDSPDLVSVIRLAARNATVTDRWRARMLPVSRPLQVARALARPSTRSRRRTDIAAHYDLGHELFSRMLDPTLTYSCAVFEHPRMSLEQAQRAKLELVCDRLELSAGDRVLEIGTGWGAFALHAASTRGCHVTTTTISADQHAYVQRLVREAGLSDRVRVLFSDYRDLRGRYDKLVSIEMIEAVGWRHTGSFLGSCSRLLQDDGAMLLQAITIDDRAYEVEKASRSFIKERIFPGGSLPSLRSLTADLAGHTDMQLALLHDLTAHYVRTLRAWRERFDRHEPELASLGYDERFRRLWRLYLAYCEAGFAERRICDVQLLAVKPRCRLRSLARGGDPMVAPRRASADEPVAGERGERLA